MISKRPTPTECFVYITLPGARGAVTAGRFVLEQTPSGDPVGRFVYGRSYLDNPDAVEIDPVELKLSGATYETVRLNGLFGAIRDAGPDYWGRRVIEKHAGITKLGELDYLLESPDDRAGALGFGTNVKPPAPRRKFNQTLDLARLQETAEALIRDDLPENPNAPQVQDLLLLGTSMGGARPKAVIQDQGELWIAKFSRPDDRWNAERVEDAMLRLARQCGIRAAESRVERVAGKDVLLVKRFDRARADGGYHRSRMISSLTVLRADDAVSDRERWSYILFVEEMRRVVSDPKGDARELFRRIVFNALISNIDDHPRNHALIAPGRDWMLSPAYDLTPTPLISQDRRDLAMQCGDLGRFANAENILSQHARFLLERGEAEKIITGIQAQISNTWEETVLASGASQRDVGPFGPHSSTPDFRVRRKSWPETGSTAAGLFRAALPMDLNGVESVDPVETKTVSAALVSIVWNHLGWFLPKVVPVLFPHSATRRARSSCLPSRADCSVTSFERIWAQ